MQKRYFEAFIKICVFATFLVPFLVIPSKFIFPFIVPKIVVFRALAVLIAGSYALLLAVNWPRYKMRVTILNVSVGLFFLSFAVSTFVGVDWYKSLWDNHERMLGLFTIFHYVVYYFAVTSVVREWRDWKWLLRLFLAAGGIVMFIGVLQKLNPELLLNRGNNRVSATLGNPIYFSGYGLFLFYVGVLLFWKEAAKGWKYFAIVGGVLGFLGVFLGGTRGTLLGLIASIGVAMVCYFFSLKEHRKIRKAISILIIAGIVISGLLFAFRHARFVQEIPALGRLLSGSFVSGTGATRLMAWEIAVEAWKEKPVFGWGPNNYYFAFNKFYRPQFLEQGWGETWFDNAHSAIFNTLATQGIVGIFLYVSLFAVAFIQLWRGYKGGAVDAHLFCIGTAFLFGHFVHNAVVFENPTSYLYFFFFLALINSQAVNYKLPTVNVGEIGKRKSDVSPALGVVAGIAVLFLIYSTDINPARANMASLKVLNSLQTGQMVVDTYKKTVEISSPHIDDIRADLVRGVVAIIPQYANAGFADKAKELYQLAYGESKKNLILHPLDIRTHLQLAQLIQHSVILLQEPTQSLGEAEAVLKDALVKSPKRQQIIYQLSILELQMGRPNEAAVLLEVAVADDPKIAEGWWRLALVYYEAGEKKKAQEVFQEAEKLGIVFGGVGKSVKDLVWATGTESNK